MKDAGFKGTLLRLPRRRALQCTIQEIHARNTGADPDQIQSIVDEAVAAARSDRRIDARRH